MQYEPLLKLRGDLASGEFLRSKIYIHDNSQFAGSTHRYIAKVALPEGRSQVLKVLVDQFSHDAIYKESLTCLLERFIQRLPSEISTLLEISPDTAPEKAADECRQQAQAAIEDCLPTQIPFAWFFVGVSRLLRCHGCTDICATGIGATDVEKRALLENYHRQGVASARRRFPETWDTARGDYVLDSRGVRFARDLCCELTHRGLLTRDSKFLDIGSGIGTMLFAVNLWSDAHATGVELHSGLMRFARSILHRLDRKDAVDSKRASLISGDVMCESTVDIASFDLLYVYSPLGKSRIDLDPIVARMKTGAFLVSERLPNKNLGMVELEPRVCDLFLLRRVAFRPI